MNWSKAKTILIFILFVVLVTAMAVTEILRVSEMNKFGLEMKELKDTVSNALKVAERQVYVYVSLDKVNHIVELLEKQGNEKSIYNFFYGHVRNYVTNPGWEALHGKQDPGITDRIVRVIITSARKYNVPLTLAFAVAQVEGGFNPRATNENGKVHVGRGKFVRSKDIGLFQCNNITFIYGGIIKSEEELYVIETNANLALRYLRAKYDESANWIGKSWFRALVAYNSGSARESKELNNAMTVGHFSTIFVTEDGLRADFCEVFGKAF